MKMYVDKNSNTTVFLLILTCCTLSGYSGWVIRDALVKPVPPPKVEVYVDNNHQIDNFIPPAPPAPACVPTPPVKPTK